MYYPFRAVYSGRINEAGGNTVYAHIKDMADSFEQLKDVDVFFPNFHAKRLCITTCKFCAMTNY